MASLESYKWQLHKLEERRGRLLRAMRLGEANALHKEIQDIEKLIKSTEELEKPKQIWDVLSNEEINEMGIIPLMIECHLITDFLEEIAYMIVDICKAHGLTRIRFVDNLDELIKKADIFACLLLKRCPDQKDMLLRNDTFNASLHKKYLKYMEQRAKQKNNKQPNNQ